MIGGEKIWRGVGKCGCIERMHTFTQFTEGFANGAEFLAEMPADLSILGKTLRKYFVTAHHMLYGSTRYTRYQKAVLRSAIKNKHSVAVLQAIASITARIEDETERWRVRRELVEKRLTEQQMRREANRRLKEVQPRPREDRVVYSNHTDGKSTLTITADATTIADLRGHIRSVRDVRKLVGEKGRLAPRKAYVNILVTLDEMVKIYRGEGNDITLRMTNGALIQGADLFNRALRDHLDGVLFHPLEGPVNAYRTKREANEKQTIMARAEHPQCSWPGCNIPATECQIHHMVAWAEGGDTNSSNLTTLCPHHNGVNDDRRLGWKAGYMARKDGKVQRMWAKPRDGARKRPDVGAPK